LSRVVALLTIGCCRCSGDFALVRYRQLCCSRGGRRQRHGCAPCRGSGDAAFVDVLLLLAHGDVAAFRHICARQKRWEGEESQLTVTSTLVCMRMALALLPASKVSACGHKGIRRCKWHYPKLHHRASHACHGHPARRPHGQRRAVVAVLAKNPNSTRERVCVCVEQERRGCGLGVEGVCLTVV
jgi:hypothetical protein